MVYMLVKAVACPSMYHFCRVEGRELGHKGNTICGPGIKRELSQMGTYPPIMRVKAGCQSTNICSRTSTRQGFVAVL